MKIEHVAWSVQDPAATAAWLVEHLGMKIVRSGGEPAHVRFLADDTGRVLLEIYNNPAVTPPDYHQNDPLLLHLAFSVEDINVERDRLLAAGATAIDPYSQNDAGDQMAMLRDPWGFPIQLMNRTEEM
jgi:glyoxylase I family protein